MTHNTSFFNQKANTLINQPDYIVVLKIIYFKINKAYFYNTPEQLLKELHEKIIRNVF